MKSEPEVYSIDDLAADKKTWWEDVRNYQARNFMMNDMQLGDVVLFYHSNAEPPGIAGLAEVCEKAQPDQNQFDKKSEYYDAKASPEKPIWFCVQVKFIKKFKKLLPLDSLKKEKQLSTMLLLKKGQRLSVQPVTKLEYQHILILTNE
jgi:predicted RNA-binding protein with PUA-like domain